MTLDRRDFLRLAAAAAPAAALAAPRFLRARNVNEKLNLAVIGVGGRGGANLAAVAGSENVTVLCDVDSGNLGRAGKVHSRARTFTDFRKQLYHATTFDAVVATSCELTLAFATLPAVQLNKHVYCEKPLTHGIWEARIIRQAAAKAKVATQMGTQIHATDNYRRVVELIRADAIG